MSGRHLKKGDALPPLEKGKTRLYSMAYCPYSHRCRMVLAHKNVPHEIVGINLRSMPEWFNPNGTVKIVPTLQEGDRFLRESSIIIDYLDEVYPNNKLYPEDPYAKAQQRVLMETTLSKITAPYYKALWGSADVKPGACEEIGKGVEFFENTLKSNFFAGDTLGMVDVYIWPWFERLTSGKAYVDFEITGDRYPKLMEWINRMHQTQAVKAARLAPKVHQEFFKTMLADDPNYDIELEL